jgi:hypothetical protein
MVHSPLGHHHTATVPWVNRVTLVTTSLRLCKGVLLPVFLCLADLSPLCRGVFSFCFCGVPSWLCFRCVYVFPSEQRLVGWYVTVQ